MELRAGDDSCVMFRREKSICIGIVDRECIGMRLIFIRKIEIEFEGYG